ncbi:hypothetical protein Pla123a_42860 [Posidoniimonas polymericola]|uniref:Uncharacterized protein n=1 Tax=Posidoniimonas polymericola TaxID=2528002 RepID=A0A5C5XXR5_9BACT|nr:hypothetical protein [Posidoniimonas polymericola]TWT67730.1 hypothetical protein Pla123a_42860 [Posidoniimonas polymericola]
MHCTPLIVAALAMSTAYAAGSELRTYRFESSDYHFHDRQFVDRTDRVTGEFAGGFSVILDHQTQTGSLDTLDLTFTQVNLHTTRVVVEPLSIQEKTVELDPVEFGRRFEPPPEIASGGWRGVYLQTIDGLIGLTSESHIMPTVIVEPFRTRYSVVFSGNTATFTMWNDSDGWYERASATATLVVPEPGSAVSGCLAVFFSAAGATRRTDFCKRRSWRPTA